jgi:hypothetical protein
LDRKVSLKSDNTVEGQHSIVPVWKRLLEELIDAQIVEKFPAYYGT